MNRRNFLSLAALAIAGKAAERVFPFRVYSIPKEIVVAKPNDGALTIDMLRTAQGQIMERLGVKPLEIYSFPVIGTVYDPSGSPSGHLKIESVNGKVLTCSSGVVHCKPGDLIVFEDKIYPSEYRKVDPSTGTFLNLARS